MKLSTVPLFIVLMSILLPVVAAYFDSKIITLVPDLLLVFAYIMLLMKRGIKMSGVDNATTLILFILICHSFIVITLGIGLGSGGVLLLFLETFIFIQLLITDEVKNSHYLYHTQLIKIYKVLVAGLVLELIICMMGYIDLFVLVAGNRIEVASYKTYNTGALLNQLGMPGLNSLILGSQSASQITVFSIFLFYSYNVKNYSNKLKYFLAASIVLLPFTTTQTSNVLILLLGYLVIFRYKLNVEIAKYKYVFLLLALPLLYVIYPKLLFRIKHIDDVYAYSNAATIFIREFPKLDLINMLLGWGRDTNSNMLEDTNVSILAIIYNAGVIVALCFLVLYYYHLKIIKLPTIGKLTPNFICKLNMLLALGWFFSLIHYSTAIEFGGRQIFAFHFAISVVLYTKNAGKNQRLVFDKKKTATY